MYNGWDESGRHSQEWIRNTNEFVNHAFDGVRSAKYGIRCPCAKCCNDIRRTKTLMTSHLCQWGFMPNYYRWTSHGEQPRSEPLNHNTEPANTLEEMLCDFGDSMHVDNDDNVKAEPTPDAKAFYAMLDVVQDPLHNVTKVSRFRAVTKLMGIKSDFNLSGECINRILNLVGGILPEGHTLPSSLYDCKSLLSGLKMPYIKIDACINHCMLYYKEDEKKVVCDFCKEPRYKEVPSDVTQRKRKPIPRAIFHYLPLIPRLQRLLMEPEIAKHMRWHMEGMRENANIMVHPADSESWKGFNEDGFADDPRNVRLVMCTDGFNPFSFGATTHSCWPVFVAPLNLPPGLCLKTENIFLSMVIPGPKGPGKNFNVYMQPLVDEMKEAWRGVQTWDSFRKENFNMMLPHDCRLIFRSTMPAQIFLPTSLRMLQIKMRLEVSSMRLQQAQLRSHRCS